MANTFENKVVKILDENNGSFCANIDTTKANISKVSVQIRKYQEGVRKYIDQNYLNFLSNHASADLYLDEGEALLRESEHLLNNTKQDASVALQEANSELASFIDELQEVSLGLKVTNRILKIEDLFKCIEELNATKEYLVVLDLLGKLNTLISCENNNAVDRVFLQCDCYNTINIKQQVLANVLQQNLQQRFDRLVQFTEKKYPQAKCVMLQISKDIVQMQDTVMALFQARYNPVNMWQFLLDNCFEPLIVKPVSVEYNEDNAEYVQLTLSYSLKELGSRLRPPYQQVFEKITLLLNCLANINVCVSAEQHVLTIIGEHIKKPFLKLLVDECLMHALPETIDELEESTLVADVSNFEHTLADTFLINIEKDRELSEFTDKFEALFQTRFLKKVLENAKDLMQKDLQDMTAVSEKTTSEDVAKNPNCFPHCMVSKGTLDLIKLMKGLLRQPNDNGAENIYLVIISTIIDTYVNEVPIIHEKLLGSIPQQSALFYNNCMFLAHYLITNVGTSLEEVSALVKSLQVDGAKYLNIQITYQQKILKGILKEFDLSNAHTLGPNQVKLIRQCLRQLELLKNVWQPVLPDEIYIKTFCDLINDFCNDIIKRILCMEDISATVANELSDIIGIILEKAPTLFKDNRNVLRVESWMKLEQLKTILNASLLEITEQWCGGAGILTANYKAEEIRHLIRALFQNTDRRAQALTQII